MKGGLGALKNRLTSRRNGPCPKSNKFPTLLVYCKKKIYKNNVFGMIYILYIIVQLLIIYYMSIIHQL